jgi:UDP-N-acetylmuramate--alanine ligase
LQKAIGRPSVKYAASFDAAVRAAVASAQDGDVILTLGAGNVSQLGVMVLEGLRQQ